MCEKSDKNKAKKRKSLYIYETKKQGALTPHFFHLLFYLHSFFSPLPVPPSLHIRTSIRMTPFTHIYAHTLSHLKYLFSNTLTRCSNAGDTIGRSNSKKGFNNNFTYNSYTSLKNEAMLSSEGGEEGVVGEGVCRRMNAVEPAVRKAWMVWALKLCGCVCVCVLCINM